MVAHALVTSGVLRCCTLAVTEDKCFVMLLVVCGGVYRVAASIACVMDMYSHMRPIAAAHA